ncbi:hypothetical protein WJX77_009714 [Trebouxia sp. C0004]
MSLPPKREWALAWVHANCRFKTCPQHVHNCQICKNLQHRQCARKVARKLVREQKVKTPCGVSVQLMVCLKESMQDKEDCTMFSAASSSEVYVELVLIDGGALEKRTMTHHMGTMSAEDWTSLECRESRDTRALLVRCGLERDLPASSELYRMEFTGDSCTQDLNCFIRDSSNANKGGPRHTFSILARACCKRTDKILGRLVTEAFEVMTPRSQGSDLIKLADFRPVAADPARYLNHIGQIASKRLQDIPRAVADFSINGRPVTVPEGLLLPQSVSTVGELQALCQWLQTYWPECPKPLQQALVPRGTLEHLKQAPPLDQDTRLRRWRDPDGMTELLFKCDQAVVQRTGLVACAQMMSASGEDVVQLAEVDRLTTDQAAFMDTLAVQALEQLWQNNHPGWDVPGAGLSSLVAVKHLFQVQPGNCICLMRGEYERMLQQEESAVLPDLRLAVPFRGALSAELALPTSCRAAPQLPSGPLQTLPQWLAAQSPPGVLPGVEPLVLQAAAASSQTASCGGPQPLPALKRPRLCSVTVVSQALTGKDPPSAQQAHPESAAASSQDALAR